jgi:hypothetical protein
MANIPHFSALRGTRYTIEGPANDERTIHIVYRFKEYGNLIIITVYAGRRGVYLPRPL